jgi:hypothetical protein
MHPPTAALRPAPGRRQLALGALAAALAAAALPMLATGGGGIATPSLAGLAEPDGPAIVPNAGQSDPRVRYEAHAGGGAVFFARSEVVLARPAGVVRLRYDGADAGPALQPVDRRAAVVNDVRRGGERALPTYGGVVYRGLYPGIDVRLDARVRGGGPWVAARYSVAAGAEPRAIRLRLEGAAAVSVDPATGGLRVRPAASGGAIVERPPIAWQQAGGERRAVEAGYRVAADGSVGLTLGPYDRGRRLLIAPPPTAGAAQAGPPALGYSTYLGGAAWDEAYDVDVDRRGNAYVAGFTFSTEFPRSGTGARAFRAVQDAFVMRFSPQGRLLYSTLLGGTAVDVAQNIAVDRRGNAYVTGRTLSPDFPTRRALQPRPRGRSCQDGPCSDAFVTKLDPSGAVAYSTYLGGTTNEEGWGIAVDRAGSAYVTGNTDSADFPTRNALAATARSRPCDSQVPCPLDVFVTKLRSSGQAIAYSTYLGGRRSDTSGGIAVDRAGRAYVSGTTRSADFPTRNAPQPRISRVACGPPPGVPCTDVFVTKLSRNGRSLRYSTYLGGAENERSAGIAVDRRGRAYVAGSTASPDFPTVGAIQATIANQSCNLPGGPKESCDDAFVAGLGPGGRTLRFSTYLGGNAEDQALGVAVGRDGAIHVAGSTDSRAMPTASALQGKLGGAIDAFVAKLAPGGRALAYSTYLGGEENERASGIAVDRAGNVLLAGRTDSTKFPVAAPVRGTLAGDIDAFVAKLRP